MGECSPDETTDASLGDALRSLRDSASCLSTDLTELNRAIGELEASTERCSETQRSASSSLADAAESLTGRTESSPASRAQTVDAVPADD